MRIMISGLGLSLLVACGATAPAPAPTNGAATAGPFVVPMDPGQITCGAVANPTALTSATFWAMGRARAAVLAGRLAAEPSEADVSQSIASYCAANPAATVRDAAVQLGV